MESIARVTLNRRLLSALALILVAQVSISLESSNEARAASVTSRSGGAPTDALVQEAIERVMSQVGPESLRTGNSSQERQAPSPQVLTSNQVLGDTGFESGSPNPFWLQGSDGRALIKQGSAHAGSFAVDTCNYNFCEEGIFQLFEVPVGFDGGTLGMWYQAPSSGEFENCYDGFLVGFAEFAGPLIDASVICIAGPTAWTQFLDGGLAGDLLAYEGEVIFVFAVALTDIDLPSRLMIDDFSFTATSDPASPPAEPDPVVATAQDGAAYVTWERPYLQGSSPVTSYEVTSVPPSVTQTLSDHRGVAMTGLSNGTSYVFHVKASNAAGGQGPEGVSNAVTPSAGVGAGPFIPVSPFRLLDTRPGEPADDDLSGAIPPNSSIAVQVTGKGTIPTSTVAAAVLNVTASEPQQSGFLTVYPDGVAQPLASNLNFSPGQTVPNLVEVAVGSNGKVKIFNGSSGTVHVIADAQGYVSTVLSGTAGLYNPLSPDRILDTRTTVPISANSGISLQATGQGNVPTSSVDAVIMNATVTEPQANGFLTVYPAGESKPLVSNVNFVGGQTVPNRLTVPVGTSGQVIIFNGSPGTVHVVIDVNGWFTDGTDLGATGGLFKGLTPARIADTRLFTGAPYSHQTLMGGNALQIKVAGQGGVPLMSAPTPPTAVVANVTIVLPTHAGFLTAFPSNVSLPTISDLNWVPGDVRPNLVVVKLAPDGTIKLFNGSSGYLDVVVDVVGWYS